MEDMFLQVEHEGTWERRDLLGVHKQKQEGLCFVGCGVPGGRIQTEDFHEVARVAEQHGDGTVRITCEENLIFVNVPEENVDALLAEPLLQKWLSNPGVYLCNSINNTEDDFLLFSLAW